MTLPCPNCGARLRVIWDDSDLQEWYDKMESAIGIRPLGIEPAIETLGPNDDLRERMMDNASECARCGGLLYPLQPVDTEAPCERADRDVRFAFVLAPDAQPEREGAS